MYRGLKTASEFAGAGDDVVVLFDGSGVEALAAISEPDNVMNALITGLRSSVLGACKYCAVSHKVRDRLDASGWPLIDEFDGEASIRRLVAEGRQVLAF